MLWHCWLGVRKSIRPVKIEWWGVSVVICLQRGADCMLAECCKRQLNRGSFILLYFRLFTFLICIEFVYLYFPVLFCLSVSVKWLAVKTASEMAYIVSSGALNSTPTNQLQIVYIWSSWCQCHSRTPSSLASFKFRLVLLVCYWLTLVILEKRSLNECSGSGSNEWRLVACPTPRVCACT